LPSADPAQIAAVRRFNRFYTRQIGLLRRSYLGSPYSLTEARVLYELAQRKLATAVELAHHLDFDAGYLSRILASFEKRGLVSRTPALYDRRQAHLALTAKGRKAFGPLDGRSAGQSAAMLEPLRREDRPRLIEAMRTIEMLLTPEPALEPAPAFTLRTHQPGDIGWIVYRHGVLYAQECGWGTAFEALIADLGAKFLREFDPARDRCWIAEKDGARVGSVLVMKAGAETAQLRLLLVEPEARGHGIAKRLVEECISFARASGYRKLMLVTHTSLDAAQHIYVKAGFHLMDAPPPAHFGEPEPRCAWEISL